MKPFEPLDTAFAGLVRAVGNIQPSVRELAGLIPSFTSCQLLVLGSALSSS